MTRIDLSLSGIGARMLHTRWFVRAPLPLYRAGLGWLFGRRIVMIEHVGRRSGLPRYVCLEVVEHPDARTLLVVSGFGEKAEWYRNLRAHPRCFVSWSRVRRAPATARFLPEAESRATLERYAARYPASWRMLRGTIEKAVDAAVDTLPMVALTLDARGAPAARR